MAAPDKALLVVAILRKTALVGVENSGIGALRDETEAASAVAALLFPMTITLNLREAVGWASASK